MTNAVNLQFLEGASVAETCNNEVTEDADCEILISNEYSRVF